MNLKTTTVVLASLCLAWLVGCADVSSTGPTPPEFFSEYRFLNADSDLGDVNISLDLGPSVSGLGFMDANSHQTYPSGNRLGVLSNGDSLRIAMTSEQRATVMILPRTGATREFIKLIERRIFDPPTTSSGRLRVAHAVVTTDADGNLVPAPSVDVTITGADTVAVEALEYTDNSGYLELTPGNYTLSVVATGDSTVLATTDVAVSNARATSVLAGDLGAAAWINMQDN